MSNPTARKFTLEDLREARRTGKSLAMLTCYDYSMARLMEEVGVPLLLVGDSAANVILGHPSTLPVSLSFMIEITRAVRRGSPSSFLIADMPFGSYQASDESAMRNICEMVKETNCDCVKLEVSPSHASLVERCRDAGIPVMAHLGLKPQSVNLLGGYKAQGRTSDAMEAIVEQARLFERSGAASILLEAVPPEVSAAVVGAVDVAVVGCGAGPACHAHVVVVHDLLNLTERAPKFVPTGEDLSDAIKRAFRRYVEVVHTGAYPGPEHLYKKQAPVE